VFSGYVVIDTETTGLSSKSERLVEYGALLLDADGVEEGFYTVLLNPGRPIPRQASMVHGIEDRDVRHSPRFREVASTVLSTLDNRAVVGHNVGFDVSFLRDEFSRCGVTWEPALVLDTLYASRRVLKGLKSHKLTTLRDVLDIESGEAHRVEADIRATHALACRIAAHDRVLKEHPFRCDDPLPGSLRARL
jgi:DNA polymerase III epsilon subunit family exonuclease